MLPPGRKLPSAILQQDPHMCDAVVRCRSDTLSIAASASTATRVLICSRRDLCNSCNVSDTLITSLSASEVMSGKVATYSREVWNDL